MSEDANFTVATPFGAPSMRSGWTRLILRALRERGIDAEALAAEVGLDAARLANPDARVAIATDTELWRRAAAATADPYFGLYVPRFVTYTTFQGLGPAVLASANLRDALARMVRYVRMIGDGLALRFEQERDRARLVLAVARGARPADEAVDAAMLLIVRVARILCDSRELSPLRVELMRDEPPFTEPYRRAFRAPVVFRASSNALAFAARDLDPPLPDWNAELSRRLDELVARAVARLDVDEIVGRVRSLVADRLPTGEPTQHTVARALGMSARTLQRRLAQAGTSYQALLSGTRMALANMYLSEGRSVTEVAYALGFAGATSFSRAFRRWTGGVPSDVRYAATRRPKPES